MDRHLVAPMLSCAEVVVVPHVELAGRHQRPAPGGRRRRTRIFRGIDRTRREQAVS